MTRYPTGRFAYPEAALLAVAIHHLNPLAFQANQLRGEFRLGAVTVLLMFPENQIRQHLVLFVGFHGAAFCREGCQIPAVQLCSEQVTQLHHPVEAERGASFFKMDDIQTVAGTEVVGVYGDFVLFHGDLLKTLPPTGVSVRTPGRVGASLWRSGYLAFRNEGLLEEADQRGRQFIDLFDDGGFSQPVQNGGVEDTDSVDLDPA